ncbi:MAG: DUF1549 domain-containing protein [Planctomycetales bacterium]
MGCNGRSCHGSFQGQGGFRLSLFGYDLKMDYDALTKGDHPRVNKENPDESLILAKPTLTMRHKGGKRLDVDSWNYNLLVRWIEGGAQPAPEAPEKLARLEVQPASIRFTAPKVTVPLKVIAHWADGSSEDVTPLCRYKSNDDGVAKVDDLGVVTSKDKGDTHIIVFYDNGIANIPTLFPYADRKPEEYASIQTPTQIDKLVADKWKTMGLFPSELSTDLEFLRRVTLDLTGTLPTPEEINTFVADNSADKRSKKINELLERPTYAAWYATRFCDLTGNNPTQLSEAVARRVQSQQWYDWMRARMEENTHWDEIVRRILLATSRKPGESYTDFQQTMIAYYRQDKPTNYGDRDMLPHYWARTNIRTADDKALSVAHNFLGIRLQCAQCHKHPFDQWTQEEFKQFAAFFQPIQLGAAPDARPLYAQQRAEFKGDQAKQREVMNKGEPFPWQEIFVGPIREAPKPGAVAKPAPKPVAKKPASQKPDPQNTNPSKPEAQANATPQNEKNELKEKGTVDLAAVAKKNGVKVDPKDADAGMMEADDKMDAPQKMDAPEKTDAPQKPNAPAKPNAKAKAKAKADPKQPASEAPASQATVAKTDGKTDAKTDAKKPEPKKPNPKKKPNPNAGLVRVAATTATLPGGSPITLHNGEDPRKHIFDWMKQKENPWFAKAIVNRIWGMHFGVGIVDPVDDLSAGNPPSNAPLLDYLSREFVAHDYDLKWLHREILNSRTYQLSWKANDSNKDDTRNFSRALLRRLPAEVLYDAVQQSVASKAELDKADESTRNRAITSDQGISGGGRAQFALNVFGRPVRLTNCDCERSTEPSLLQTIYLHNDQDLLASLQKSGWLQEINRDLAKTAPPSPKLVAAREERTKLNQEVRGVQKQLNKLKKAKSEDKQALEDLEKKLKALQAKATQLDKQINQINQARAILASDVPVSDQENFIREAYLRTLSRPPTPEEVDRCKQHLRDSKDYLASSRDLVWALLNTKEFIVNH